MMMVMVMVMMITVMVMMIKQEISIVTLMSKVTTLDLDMIIDYDDHDGGHDDGYDDHDDQALDLKCYFYVKSDHL